MRRHLLWITAVLPALALAPAGALAQAHAHIGHVAESWNDTPGKVGLIEILETEVKIARQHSGFAADKLSDLGWMKTHVRHVRHAIDPSSEDGGPGKGYGVIKAAKGVAAHIGFAAGSPDASDNVKLHATHVSTSAGNIVTWADEVMALSDKVLAAGSAEEAAQYVRQIGDYCTRIVEGYGDKTWKEGEGGLAQARQHLGFLMKGEGMM